MGIAKRMKNKARWTFSIHWASYLMFCTYIRIRQQQISNRRRNYTHRKGRCLLHKWQELSLY